MISISQLSSSGFEIRSTNDKVTIGLNGKICISSLLHDNLYLLDNSKVVIKSSSSYLLCVNKCVNGFSLLWHYILGHISKNKITIMVRDEFLSNIKKVEYPMCEPYLSERMVKKPFPKGSRDSELLDLKHSNICRP